MSKQKTFSTALTKVNETYFPMIERQIAGNGIKFDDYAKQCVLNAISAINNVLDTNGINWNDPQLDHSNITQILLRVAALRLNAAANPNEVFFTLRNVKQKKKDGKDVWKKQIEMGIEGDGNDAILSNFGRNVKQVMKYWEVRENDLFEYPMYNGLEMTPPKWQPRGTGKVVRVVYPIIMKNDIVEYYIAEREDVIKNLIAHLNNNLMNETFGIAKDRFSATPEQKAEIEKKKNEIIQKAKKLGLDKALEDGEIRKYISPAWKDEHSRESMIVRKMRNNIVKKIPKDFGSSFIEFTYNEVTSEIQTEAIREEIQENANREVIDIIPEESEEVYGGMYEESNNADEVTENHTEDVEQSAEEEKAEEQQSLFDDEEKSKEERRGF